jgi:Holliday junction resolvase
MSKSYRKGYQIELLCKQRLQKMGFIVIRSSRSLTPIDLVAINPKEHEIWLIQAKREEAPADLAKLEERFSELRKLGGSYTVRTFVYMRKKRKYDFIETS